MGGNNFDSLVRLPAKEYKELEDSVMVNLERAFFDMFCENRKNSYYDYSCEWFRAYTIPHYHNKESFGDMDILVPNWSTQHATPLLHKLDEAGLISHENGKLMVGNGPFTSYPIKSPLGTFQLDIIGGFDESEAEFARTYFAYNDLGNFVGRFAHKIGLKYGHRGLFYPLHWTDSQGKDVYLGDIQLSKNPEEVLGFLQFDIERWHKGFETMEEIYEMVVDHPWFYSDMFNLKDVSHDARVRDRKRKNYSNLLQYIEKHKSRLNDINYFLDKWKYLELINSKFPTLEVEIRQRVSDFLLKEEIKKRWNGNNVMEQSELAGFPIKGKAIGEFNSFYKLKDLELLKLDQSQINAYIFDKVKEWKENI